MNRALLEEAMQKFAYTLGFERPPSGTCSSRASGQPIGWYYGNYYEKFRP